MRAFKDEVGGAPTPSCDLCPKRMEFRELAATLRVGHRSVSARVNHQPQCQVIIGLEARMVVVDGTQRWVMQMLVPDNGARTLCSDHQPLNSGASARTRSTSVVKAVSPGQRSCSARDGATTRRASSAQPDPNTCRATGSVSIQCRMLRSSSVARAKSPNSAIAASFQASTSRFRATR